MKDTQSFEQALGASKPWTVKEVRMDVGGRTVDVMIECLDKTVWGSEADERLHIHSWEERSWKHLDTKQLETQLHARILFFLGKLELYSNQQSQLEIPRFFKKSPIDHFSEVFGEEFCAGIRFLCSDMWKPYLNSASRFSPNALLILDRFQIVKKLNEANDLIRREEVRLGTALGLEPLLKNEMGLPEKRLQLDEVPVQTHESH